MESAAIQEILQTMTCPFSPAQASLTQLVHEEDGAPYQVYRIEADGKHYILKQAKEYEAEVYQKLLKDAGSCVPKIYATAEAAGETYLLMEYIPGGDLRKCTRHALILALDALIALQKRYWNSDSTVGYTYEESLVHRKKRGTYLCDPQLEQAYEIFLHDYASLPRTLCHDDLLPFNVLFAGERAVFIDWEFAGILPYPTSFARLIAHGEEDENAFFHMTAADREFAIDYYYEKLLAEQGISYRAWREALLSFLLYEACEWVMIGNKYGEKDSPYFQKYLPMAKQLAEEMQKRTAGAPCE